MPFSGLCQTALIVKRRIVSSNNVRMILSFSFKDVFISFVTNGIIPVRELSAAMEWLPFTWNSASLRKIYPTSSDCNNIVIILVSQRSSIHCVMENGEKTKDAKGKVLEDVARSLDGNSEFTYQWDIDDLSSGRNIQGRRERRGKGVLSQAGILLVDGGQVLEGNGSRNPRYSLVIFSVISYFTTFVLFDGLLFCILYTVALIDDWMIVDSSKESLRWMFAFLALVTCILLCLWRRTRWYIRYIYILLSSFRFRRILLEWGLLPKILRLPLELVICICSTVSWIMHDCRSDISFQGQFCTLQSRKPFHLLAPIASSDFGFFPVPLFRGQNIIRFARDSIESSNRFLSLSNHRFPRYRRIWLSAIFRAYVVSCRVAASVIGIAFQKTVKPEIWIIAFTRKLCKSYNVFLSNGKVLFLLALLAYKYPLYIQLFGKKSSLQFGLVSSYFFWRSPIYSDT